MNTQKHVTELCVNEKRDKLINLMQSVIDGATHHKEMAAVFDKFSLTKEMITQAFLDYNLDVYSHDNSIYQFDATRVVLHIHNLIQGSWHIERQEAVCQLLKRAQPKKAIDLGFGVPSRYVRELLASPSFHLTLCDYKPSAAMFAEVLLGLWAPEWSEHIDFLCEDMEKVSACVGDYDLYISLHSIEHVTNPTTCLREYVELASPEAQFLIEIPIGPITPEHNMAWASIAEAQSWVDSVGLRIIDDRMTSVNPEVDLFAEPHGYNYGGYLMLCRKV
jgi:2-polyprenyl-3-methyl-5-hydroxy-6-metoxy-1,4-benzoquinol methylase